MKKNKKTSVYTQKIKDYISYKKKCINPKKHTLLLGPNIPPNKVVLPSVFMVDGELTLFAPDTPDDKVVYVDEKNDLS